MKGKKLQDFKLINRKIKTSFGSNNIEIYK